jgi:glycosyltransferase involved in cell wall biosynthesis
MSPGKSFRTLQTDSVFQYRNQIGLLIQSIKSMSFHAELPHPRTFRPIMSIPLVSVVLTTYNSARVIKNTLASILSQEGQGSVFNLEVLVVDDCSTDETRTIVARFPEVRLLQTSSNSGGPNCGRNIALREMTGDYFCIADHDDVWKPHRISVLLANAGDAPIVSSGYEVNQGPGKPVLVRTQRTFPSGAVIRYARNETFLKRLSKSHDGQICYLGGLLLAKPLSNILFEEHFGAVDFDWIVRIFEERESIEVNEALYIRNETGNNLSMNKNYRRKDYYYSLLSVEQFEDRWPEVVSLARKRIHGSRARYHYVVGDMKNARYYFRLSGFSMLNLAYVLTSFAGHRWVVKKFKVFG